MFIKTYFTKKIQYKPEKFFEISLCKAPFTTSNRIILSFRVFYLEHDIDDGEIYANIWWWKNFCLADIKTPMGKEYAKQEKRLNKIYKEKKK